AWFEVNSNDCVHLDEFAVELQRFPAPLLYGFYDRLSQHRFTLKHFYIGRLSTLIHLNFDCDGSEHGRTFGVSWNCWPHHLQNLCHRRLTDNADSTLGGYLRASAGSGEDDCESDTSLKDSHIISTDTAAGPDVPIDSK